MRGRFSKSESGVALITALLLLASMSAVTAAAVALGLYLSQETSASGRSAQSRYLAESALNRTVFYLKNDVASHTMRTLGAVDYNKRDAIFVQPRFMADGTTHDLEMADKTLSVTVSDAAGGFPLTPFATLSTRLNERRERKLDGERASLEEEWDFARFLNRLSDFLDDDDGRRLDGMEKAEYLKAGRANLPRNGEVQYREELLWIPGAAEHLGDFDDIQPLPPHGLAALPDEVRLYSSPVDLIAEKADLTKEESQKLETALQRWRESGVFLEDSLSSAIYGKLLKEGNGISMDESGFFRVRIKLPDSPKELNAVFRLAGGSNYLEFYEYSFL